jgi:Fe-S-cluster-containing dehydrogenase component/DMSO reductase anchor subunit
MGQHFMITWLKLKEPISMRKGFIFNHNRCVNCNACKAACIIENGWSVHLRNIFTYNPFAEVSLPVINLSLACNHCESASCTEGCPTTALSRDSVTGAVILDEKKCIGCRYCQWNCPYDAPRFDSKNRVIIKCNLCYSSLAENHQPACSSACPTGALKFGQLSEILRENIYSWFPEKKLNPAIEFTGKNYGPVKIFPERSEPEMKPANGNKKKNVLSEISLIVFSFLSTISVAVILTSFIKGVYPEKIMFNSMLLLTVLASIMHLGKKKRAWRSLSNLRKSPLSREIAAFLLFIATASAASILQIPVMLIVSSVIGLIFLILVDSVYAFSDKRKKVIFNSGQTFISSLIMVSFFSGRILPFVFLATIKVISFVYLNLKKTDNNNVSLRFLRIAFLIIPWMSLILHHGHSDFFIVLIFITGELFDRILFYIDFNPLNINNLISENFNLDRNEKERG